MKRSSIASAMYLVSVFWLVVLLPVRGLLAENGSGTQSIEKSSYEEKLKRWNSFSEEKKEAIRRRARGMSEKKFGELENNFKKMRKFEPVEQTRVKQNFQRMRKFKPQQRSRVRENFQRFNKLPSERKMHFRQKFAPEFNKQRLNRNEHKPGQKGRGNQFRMPDPSQRKFDPKKPGERPGLRKTRDGQPGNAKLRNRPGERPEPRKTRDGQPGNGKFRNQSGERPGHENGNLERKPGHQKKPQLEMNKPGNERKQPGGNLPGNKNRFRRPFRRNEGNMEKRNGEVRKFRQRMMDNIPEKDQNDQRFRQRYGEIKDFRERFVSPENDAGMRGARRDSGKFPHPPGTVNNRPGNNEDGSNLTEKNGRARPDRLGRKDGQGKIERPERPMRQFKPLDRSDRPDEKFRPRNRLPGENGPKRKISGQNRPIRNLPKKNIK